MCRSVAVAVKGPLLFSLPPGLRCLAVDTSEACRGWLACSAAFMRVDAFSLCLPTVPAPTSRALLC